MKVLMFEDNYISGWALQMMIEELGHTVVGNFDDADDLEKLVTENRPECILMDIQLKGNISGLDAVEELRKVSQIPVIFLSGNNAKEIINRIELVGNASILTKPYTETDIKERLEEISSAKD